MSDGNWKKGNREYEINGDLKQNPKGLGKGTELKASKKLMGDNEGPSETGDQELCRVWVQEQTRWAIALEFSWAVEAEG